MYLQDYVSKYPSQSGVTIIGRISSEQLQSNVKDHCQHVLPAKTIIIIKINIATPPSFHTHDVSNTVQFLNFVTKFNYLSMEHKYIPCVFVHDPGDSDVLIETNHLSTQLHLKFFIIQ